jgi:hypothetical protein
MHIMLGATGTDSISTTVSPPLAVEIAIDAGKASAGEVISFTTTPTGSASIAWRPGRASRSIR